ncbi:hypothetical protein FG477_00750, partial [Xylella fastidiosa subsp. multiplex]|uniref:hypothetical protein n=1 Tax=Xylella fastidiosa TaxID=2371 RepID=UPI00130D31BC
MRFPDSKDCDVFFRNLCQDKLPTVGHEALVDLFRFAPALFRVTITTNFDQLVEKAFGFRGVVALMLADHDKALAAAFLDDVAKP